VAEIGLANISGGTCNPARLIGPAAVLYKFGSNIWIPILAQFIGAMVGAMLYDEIFKRINGPKGNKNF
jgi:glycerol uptake facilitator-like aquaporin